jgi:menaquinone-dependent protoporphyrinogen IX oxidase
MSNILIGYTTNAGSTREIVDTMASEIRKAGHSVDVDLLSNKPDVDIYDAVVIGAPMILGWHKDAVVYIKKQETVLAKKKVAYFTTSLKLTRVPTAKLSAIPFSFDPTLVADPKDSRKLGFKERFTSVDHYVAPMIGTAPAIKPINIAFFNGKLDMSKLNLFQKAFVSLIVQATPGDFRNWDFIKAWSIDFARELAG